MFGSTYTQLFLAGSADLIGPRGTLAVLLTGVIGMVVAGGLLTTGAEAYREAFAAIGRLFAGPLRVAVVGTLLVATLLLVVGSG
ncbi:MAG TPA: hypothetical protein VGD67_04735 [Pseudonocardiaceae bacterium]